MHSHSEACRGESPGHWGPTSPLKLSSGAPHFLGSKPKYRLGSCQAAGFGPVVQPGKPWCPERTSPSHGEGRGFKSLPAHHKCPPAQMIEYFLSRQKLGFNKQ